MDLLEESKVAKVIPPRLVPFCLRIRAIISDVDGVLTDGRLWIGQNGSEIKSFHVRDGMGCYLWKKAGYRLGLITKRRSSALEQRAREMGADSVKQAVGPKWPAVKTLLEEWGIPPEEVCYLGDDLPDLSVMGKVGFAVAVADAAWELRGAAHYVTQACGGAGALRETIELILRAQGRWERLVADYIAEESGPESSGKQPFPEVLSPGVHETA